MKANQLGLNELYEIGKQEEIKFGETEEEMLLKREDPKLRIERLLKENFEKESTIWMTERVLAAQDPFV